MLRKYIVIVFYYYLLESMNRFSTFFEHDSGLTISKERGVLTGEKLIAAETPIERNKYLFV